MMDFAYTQSINNILINALLFVYAFYAIERVMDEHDAAHLLIIYRCGLLVFAQLLTHDEDHLLIIRPHA